MSNAGGWGGRKVTQARAHIAALLPAPCGQCGRPVKPSDRWVVGHIIARSLRPELTWEPSNWRVEHRTCSDRTAYAAVVAKREQFSPAGRAGQPPLPAFSLSAPLAVPEDMQWAAHVAGGRPWLLPYLTVPEEVASAPLAMTPPHPEAVGSYGPALIEWARETQGITVRWWQGLSLCRMLEHREDGSLCWEEVLISCSRRSGKSVIVRLLALWRMVFAPALFAEMQLVVHSASTLRIAKEPMRYASRWASGQPHLKVSTNNNNYSIEDQEEGHRWIVLPPDNTAGLDTNLGIVDEAWAAKPEVVDDDLEPSLMERVSPQLVLVSTAHRRATSLMRTRIAGALAGEGQGRVLLLLWAAQPTDDPAVVATWKRASPHWSAQREAYVARKYEKAVRGEQDVEFDDPDPMAGFRSQYLNLWRLAERRERGEAVVEAEAWAELADPESVPLGPPDAAAVESWFGPASLVLAWMVAGRVVVSASDHPDLPAAVAALRESGFGGSVTVGASLLSDPSLKGVAVRKGEGRTIASVQALSRLLSEDALRHDGRDHLTGQVLGLRTLPGAEGLRLVSSGRADAVKAAMWAAQSLRRKARAGRQRILTASQ